jgi:hypothetical protein
MEEMKKRYCIECDHCVPKFALSGIISYQQDSLICYCPANKRVVDTPYKRQVEYIYTIQEKNKNNDCDWFEPRPSIGLFSNEYKPSFYGYLFIDQMIVGILEICTFVGYFIFKIREVWRFLKGG